MCAQASKYERTGDAEWLEADQSTASRAITFDWSSIATARCALEETVNQAFRTKVLKQIAELMQGYPTVPLVVTRSKIAIACIAPDGFPMSILIEGGRYVVNLGKWRDELVRAEEAVGLIDAALRGVIRLRIDIDARGEHCAAERRLPNGDWITLPHYDDDDDDVPLVGPVRTVYLRNGRDVP